MRRVWLSREDFGLFHQDITPQEYEFFRTHAGAFKRMWNEQTRRFWSLFVNAFEYFIWKYGIMKDFPMTVEEAREYIDEIVFYIRDQFVDGRISTAKNLVMDCVIVTQNRHCIAQLDKASYTQNPFYMKETREIFRQLFGPPSHRKTFMKVLCGLPVYIKFAGAAVACLRRWLTADNIPSDEKLESEFLDTVHSRSKSDKLALDYGAELLLTVGRLGEQTTANTSLAKKRDSPPSLPDKPKRSKDSVVVSADDKHKKTQQKKEKEEEKEEATASKKKRKKKKKNSSQSSSDPCELSTEKKDKGGGDKDVVAKDVDKELKKDIDKDANKVGDNDVNKQAAGVSKRRVKTEPVGAEELKKTKTKMKMVVGGGAIDRAVADKESVRREHANTENDSDISYCSSPNSTTESISSVGGAEPVSTEMSKDDASVDKDTMISKEDAVTKKSDIVNKEATVEKEESAVAKEVDVRKKKRVHTCAFCGLGETMTKSYKRCQKCRGLPNPKYYCSRECQAKHWKEHKLDHKEESSVTDAAELTPAKTQNS